jgi:uncharacterized protein YciI
MYVVELDFADDPRRLDARPAHRERLQALSSQGTLVLAGPWADDAGALLVFDLPSEAALREVMDGDPYYGTRMSPSAGSASGSRSRRRPGWRPSGAT